jgi:hypothetical protein
MMKATGPRKIGISSFTPGATTGARGLLVTDCSLAAP